MSLLVNHASKPMSFSKKVTFDPSQAHVKVYSELVDQYDSLVVSICCIFK